MSVFWTKEEVGPGRKEVGLWDQSPQNLERPNSFPERRLRTGPLGESQAASENGLVALQVANPEKSTTPLWSEKPEAGWSSVSCPFSVSCSWRRIQARDWAAWVWGEGQQCRCLLHLFTQTPADRQVNLVSLFIIKWLIEMLLCIYLSSLCFYLVVNWSREYR